MSDIEKLKHKKEELTPRQELVNFLEKSFNYFIEEKGIKIYIKVKSIYPPFDLQGKYPPIDFSSETAMQLLSEEEVRGEKNFFDFVISKGSSYTTNSNSDWLDMVSSKFYVQFLKDKKYFELDIDQLKEKLNTLVKDINPSLDLSTFDFKKDSDLREKVETLLMFILIDQTRDKYLPGEKNINVQLQ